MNALLLLLLLLLLWSTSQVDQIYPNPKTTAFFTQIAEEINAQDPEVRFRGVGSLFCLANSFCHRFSRSVWFGCRFSNVYTFCTFFAAFASIVGTSVSI